MATTRKPPPPWNAQAPIVDDKGFPTIEFLRWLNAMIAWAAQADATIT